MALPRYHRKAVRVLVGSVVVGAVLGIYALLASDPGRVEMKLLATSFAISGACLLAVACGAAWGRGLFASLAPLGVVLALLGFGLLIALVWAESDSEGAWKTAGTAILFATTATYLALLGLARLAPNFAWLAVGAALAALALTLIWAGLLWEAIHGTTGLWRGIGVISILFGAFTILVPVFHRAYARSDSRAAGVGARGAFRAVYCPRCGFELATDESRSCAACGALFRVTFLE